MVADDDIYAASKNGMPWPDIEDIAQFSPAVKAYWTIRDALVIEDDVLQRKWENYDGSEIIPQKKGLEDILQELHSESQLRLNQTLKNPEKNSIDWTVE